MVSFGNIVPCQTFSAMLKFISVQKSLMHTGVPHFFPLDQTKLGHKTYFPNPQLEMPFSPEPSSC